MFFLRLEEKQIGYGFVFTSCLAKETVHWLCYFLVQVSDPLRPLKLRNTVLFRVVLRMCVFWGAWMAHSVKPLALDFGLGCDLRVTRLRSYLLQFIPELHGTTVSWPTSPFRCLCVLPANVWGGRVKKRNLGTNVRSSWPKYFMNYNLSVSQVAIIEN